MTMLKNLMNRIAGAACISLALVSSANALVTLELQELLNNGGDSVALDGEWAFVGDLNACVAYVYRFDYVTRKWGDGAGNQGQAYSTVGLPAGSQCGPDGYGDFGFSLDVSGNVLVVGAPGLKGGSSNEFGRVFVYEFNGTDWVQKALIDPESADQQTGMAFSEAISLHEGPQGKTIIAISAPGFDSATENSTGKVYLYTWDGTNVDFVLGDIRKSVANPAKASDLFGFSLDMGGNLSGSEVYLIAGAPGHDGLKTNQGLVELWRCDIAIPDCRLTAQYFNLDVFPTNYQFGIDVSIGDENVVLISGIDTWVGVPSSDPHPIQGQGDFTRLGPTSYGAVAQYKGYALVGSLLGSAHYLAVYTDDKNIENAYALEFQSDSDFAKRADFDFTRIISSGSNKAYAYTLPGCLGGSLAPNVWTMISISCDLGSATLADIFGDDLGTDWEFWEQGGANYYGGSYRQMAGTETVKQDRSYWIVSTASDSQGFELDNHPNVTGSVTTLTIPDPIRDQVVGAFELNVKSLTAGLTVPTEDIRVMLPNPFAKGMEWPDVLLEKGSDGAFRRLDDVDFNMFFRPGGAGTDPDLNAYVFDASADVFKPVAYNTPGTRTTIEPGEGYFVRFGDEFTTTADILLYLPLGK